MSQPLTAEERATLGWPEEAAGVDTIRTPATAAPAIVGRWDPETRTMSKPEGFYPAGPVVIETAEGEYRSEHLWGLRGGPYDTEEEAIERGNKQALKQLAASRRARALHDRWDRTVTAMAPGNSRQARLREGWTMADHHRPLVGEHVILWAHGGHRTAIVVETTKGRGVTVAYATPSSPLDVHLTKTTKYAVSTGPRPMSMGV